MEGSQDSLNVLSPSLGGSSNVLLTPGRTRNIAQDMEALRLSRQDNPYLEQVMASRESLIESHADEFNSDDTILMSQEFGSTTLDFIGEDPLTLREVHEHMIRSPPPTSCWSYDAFARGTSSAFDFDTDYTFTTHSVDSQDKDFLGRSPRRIKGFDCTSRSRTSRSASPRSHDTMCGRPLSLPGETHIRNALGRKQTTQPSERFSLLQQPRRTRRDSRGDDNERLVAHCDN